MKIQLNHSSFLSEITHYAETSRDIIMLDSSVLVAGVVIGVVLFLSCVAILIGSLRKNQCFRHLQLYEECVGPGAAQIYLPTEDPPPYSLIDPCQQNDVSINNPLEERGSTSTTMGRDSEGLVRIQDLHQPSMASSSPFPPETAPPYEAVVCEQNVPLPQVSLALLKSSADYHRTLFDRIA
ncbi:Protein BEAN1, partial [Ophiophagus hannah]